MKKIFTSLSAVLLTVGAAYSQQEQPAFSVAASALNTTNAKVESVVNFTNSAVSSAAKLSEISDIISVAPEGEEKIYYRRHSIWMARSRYTRKSMASSCA